MANDELSQLHIDDNVFDSAVPTTAGSSTWLSFSIVDAELFDNDEQ